MELKCCPCTDQAIADGETDLAAVPAAVTIVPVVQTFNVSGQQIAAPVTMPICLACRKKMLVAVSKSGLVTA